MIERVVLVSPRGFCAGVVRAIATVERALAIYGPPVYVRRAIVHNSRVVARLTVAGATFVHDLDQVPRGGIVVLSAHGVAPSVYEEARARGLHVVDATCPLVTKVHKEVARFSNHGFDVILIGHAGHDEVVGTMGQAANVQLVERASDVAEVHVTDPNRVACLTQTTLSPRDVAPLLGALRQRFPALVQPGAADICYATRNRQAAVTWLARTVDVVIVVGDGSSSNSRRLCETAGATGPPSHRVATAAELDEGWLVDAKVVGITAGASTPEGVVAEVVDRLSANGAVVEERAFVDEHVTFALPRELVSTMPLIGEPLSSRHGRVGDAGA